MRKRKKLLNKMRKIFIKINNLKFLIDLKNWPENL